MEIRLQIFAIALVVLYFVLVLRFILKKKVVLKHSFLWLFGGLIMAICACFPNILEIGAEILGIQVPLNMLFALSIFLLVIILFYFTTIISDLSEKNKKMIQQLALLEQRIRELESK